MIWLRFFRRRYSRPETKKHKRGVCTPRSLPRPKDQFSRSLLSVLFDANGERREKKANTRGENGVRPKGSAALGAPRSVTHCIFIFRF